MSATLDAAPIQLTISLARAAVTDLDADLLAAIAAVRDRRANAVRTGDAATVVRLTSRLARLRSLRVALRQAARALGPDAQATTPTNGAP